MKKTWLVVLIALLLAACAPRAAAPLPEYGIVGMDEQTSPAVAATAGPPKSASLPEIAADTGALETRMVVKNADLRLVVADVQEKMNAIAQMAEREGGFVLSTNRYQSYAASGATVPEATIAIRVPSDRFDAVIADIEADVLDVLQDNRSGQDVTAEYVDLEGRLKARQAAAARLEQLLQQAGDTQAVLDLFRELESINAEIESIKGQMQYYETASSYSLINVTLVAEEKVQPIKVGRWQPRGTANRAIQALIKFLQGFVNFLIWFVLFILPMLLLVFGPPALIVWGIIRAIRRRKAGKKPTAG